MGDGSSRDQYVEKIWTLRKKAVLRDKFIVVLNKVDLSSSVQSGGVYDARMQRKRCVRHIRVSLRSLRIRTPSQAFSSLATPLL